jgi:hypothetical protein
MLFHLDVNYEYEQELELKDGAPPIHPDFLFTDPGGDRIVWEHLGMLSREDYRRSWENRKKDYEQAGFVVGKTSSRRRTMSGEALTQSTSRRSRNKSGSCCKNALTAEGDTKPRILATGAPRSVKIRRGR